MRSPRGAPVRDSGKRSSSFRARKIRLRPEHHRELTISGREASAADRNLTFAAIGLSSTWSVPDEQKAVQFLTGSQVAGMCLAASPCRGPRVTTEAGMQL